MLVALKVCNVKLSKDSNFIGWYYPLVFKLAMLRTVSHEKSSLIIPPPGNSHYYYFSDYTILFFLVYSCIYFL